MQNTFTIDADIKKTSYFNQPTVTQNDDITFIINITDDGQAFDLTNVTTVALANTRLDKEVIVTPGIISGTNQVTFNLGTNETAVSSSVSAVVQLYDASGRVSTLSFSYSVKSDPTGAGYVPSETEITFIEFVLNDALVATNNANTQALFAQTEASNLSQLKSDTVTATTNANNATTAANTATTNANTQADYALAQGDYALAQGDYANTAGESSITNWLAPVANYAAIGTTYLTPVLGDTVQALDDGYVYRFNGTEWIYTQGYSATAIADANNSITTLDTKVNTNKTEVDAHKADYANKFYDNAGAHNSIYRGKYLGTSLTPTQQTAISSGTFEDLYIGDYWTIGGVNYRIAGFNYFRNVGDTALTANHVTIVPDTTLYTAQMNGTNITTGGYVGSEMRTTNLAQAITTIEAAFPARVITNRQILTNATLDGKASGWSWYDSKVELMNEVMVYGSVAWGEATYNSGYNVGSSHGRLPLFALRQDMVNTRQTYWLRDVISAAHFAIAASHGTAVNNNASTAFGVRPAFSIS